jgi:hypothetical protein
MMNVEARGRISFIAWSFPIPNLNPNPNYTRKIKIRKDQPKAGIDRAKIMIAFRGAGVNMGGS